MTRQVNLYEAKTNLSQLVEDAAKGEEIIIAKNGKPMAKLTVVTPVKVPQERQFGQFAYLVDPNDKRTREEWLRDWRKLDEEILQDFKSLQEEPGGYDPKWPATSSIPMPFSGPKRTRKRSGAKRSRK